MPTISFKISSEEAGIIRKRARQEKLTLSEFLRRQATAPLQPVAKILIRPCPVTGARIFDGKEQMSPLTVETTREILSNFP